MKKDTSLDSYYFHLGTNYESYNFLGCTLERTADKYVYFFRTWAPNAHRVGLISDFTGWDHDLPFDRITDNGIWELR